MIDKYKEEQQLITELLTKEIENDKIVQAYMFCSDDIDYIYDYAIQFSKSLITKNSPNKEKIIDQIDKGIYNELQTLEPINNIIRKDQFLELRKKIDKKPIEGNKIIYIIKNCEKLNIATANAMLKFIEESTDDLIAIFLTNNLDMVIPTIKSRCQVLNFSTVEKKDLVKLLSKNYDFEIEVIENYIKKTINFVEEYEKNGINVFYTQKNFFQELSSDSNLISLFLKIMLYFYYDLFNELIINEPKFFVEYVENIEKIKAMSDVNKIIKKIEIIEKISRDNLYNLNQKLLLDRLVIELSEVK